MAEYTTISDEIAIRNRIESRRALMEKQNLVNDYKSRLCNKVNSGKPPHLETIIRAFEHENPSLYTYIRYLETIKYGVWCNNCNEPKNINVEGIVSNSTTAVVDNTLHERVDKLQVSIEAAEFAAQDYCRLLEQHDEKLHELYAKINMTKNEIDKLRAGNAGHLKSADLLA